MAKIYHVRLNPREAKPIIRLSREREWSFNKAAKKLIEYATKQRRKVA